MVGFSSLNPLRYTLMASDAWSIDPALIAMWGIVPVAKAPNDTGNLRRIRVTRYYDPDRVADIVVVEENFEGELSVRSTYSTSVGGGLCEPPKGPRRPDQMGYFAPVYTKDWV